MAAMAGTFQRFWATLAIPTATSWRGARALVEGAEAPQSSGRSVDERVKDAGYAAQDAQGLLRRWLEASAAYHAFMAGLPEDDEELWGRGSGFTLNDQLVLSAYHDLDHLHQIVKIIRG